MASLVGIKYVGKKRRPQPDTVAGTSLIWRDTREVHFVPDTVASKLLKHPDVWAVTQEVRVSDAKVREAEQKLAVEVRKENEIEEQPPLPPLDQMDKKALHDFAQQHFGEKLHHAMSETTMRSKIMALMNSGRNR